MSSSKTIQYRRAFVMLKRESITRVAEKLELPRRQLSTQYKNFLQSGVALNQYEYKEKKRGRKPALPKDQEEALKIFAHTSDRLGDPISNEDFEMKLKETSEKPLSQATLKRYREKAQLPTPELQSKIDEIGAFFSLMKETIEEHNIEQRNIYTVDHTGVQICARTGYSETIRRDSVGTSRLTVMLTTAADGSLLPTTFISGKKGETTVNIPEDSTFPKESKEFNHTVQSKAVVDVEVFRWWLTKFIVFIDQNRREKEENVLIILDGQSSPVDILTLMLARSWRVHIIRLASPSSVMLPSEAILSQVVKDHLQKAGNDISLPALCTEVLQKNLSKEISSSFERTGIWPMDPEVAIRRFREENSLILAPSSQRLVDLAEQTIRSERDL